MKAIEILRSVDVNAVTSAVRDERRHEFRMALAPLAAADIRSVGKDLVAHIS